MNSTWKRWLALAALHACMTGSASAAIISGSTSFVAWNFGASAPSDPVSGTVSFSFDNSANIFNAANGAIVNGSPIQVFIDHVSLPGNWTPVLTYFKNAVVNNMVVQDVLAIGDLLNGTVVLTGTEDWRVAFNNASGQQSFRELTYATANTSRLFVSTQGVVPEPGVLALLSLALGGLGLAQAKRRVL